MRRYASILVACWLAVGVLACGGPLIHPRLTPTPRPTRTPLPPPGAPPTATPAPATPTATISPAWETWMPGLEYRVMRLYPRGLNIGVGVALVRLDPARFDLRVHYRPSAPTTVSGWQARTDAALVVNGGFFMANNQTLGLLSADGEMYGDSFDEHGGMLSVNDGEISIRSLAQFPYQPGETFEQAVQGRPMLLYPGGFPAEFDLASDSSRRTAVAQDGAGRLLFVVIDYGAVTLYDLRDWLDDTRELDVFVAFNLDGGGSTGMAVEVGDHALLIDSWSDIPSVIAVYPKP